MKKSYTTVKYRPITYYYSKENYKSLDMPDLPYVMDPEQDAKIQKIKKLTEDYLKAVKKTHNLAERRELLYKYNGDILINDPGWYSLHSDYLPALFPELQTNKIGLNKILYRKELVLMQCAKVYDQQESNATAAAKIDHHRFNKFIKLLGQSQQSLKRNLSPEKYELAMKENEGYISYLDSVILNKLFMIENLNRIIDEISKNPEFTGYKFVEDVKNHVAKNYDFRCNGREYYLMYLLEQTKQYVAIKPYSMNEKYVGDKIDKNVHSVDRINLCDERGRNLMLNTKYISAEVVKEENEEPEDMLEYVEQKYKLEKTMEVEHELSEKTLLENLPEGVTLHRVKSGRYYITIDPFPITEEMIDKAIAKYTYLSHSHKQFDNPEKSVFEM